MTLRENGLGASQENMMKKLIATHWTTLDGYISGPNEEMDWLLVDEQMSGYEIGMVSHADTLLLGRQTYLDFAGYWPAAATNPDSASWEREYGGKVDALKKVVVSRTLQEAAWKDSTLWRTLTPTRVEELKAGPGQGIIIYGSARILQQLTNMGLIDEYHLLVHPVLLGSGRLLFENIEQRLKLKRVRVELFESGVLLMVYRRIK